MSRSFPSPTGIYEVIGEGRGGEEGGGKKEKVGYAFHLFACAYTDWSFFFGKVLIQVTTFVLST